MSLNTQEETPAGIPLERKAELFDNAVASALGLYEREDLYTMLHDCFKLTIQEIRTQGYLTDQEMSDICHVPPQMLEGGMTVRDILRLHSVSDRACLSHKDSDVLIPLEDLRRLTGSGQEEFSALMDAYVADIRIDEEVPELVLEGVEAGELERFCETYCAFQEAEQAMGPVM